MLLSSIKPNSHTHHYTFLSAELNTQTPTHTHHHTFLSAELNTQTPWLSR
jgi:hypothetical protein